MNRTPWIAAIAIAAAFCMPALGQFGLSAKPPVLIRDATVLVDGKMVENCDIIVVGKRIREVGPDLATPEGAIVIDAAGKFVMPTLVDLETRVGVATQAQSQQPRHLALNAVDPYAIDPWYEALQAGVGHAYLAGAAAAGAGGRGRGLEMPARPGVTIEELEIAGSDAVHVRLGTESGPIGRRNQLIAFRKYVESAKKYQETWNKYREDLEKYEKDLAEYAKKKGPGKGKPSKGKGASKAASAPKKGSGARPPRPTPLPKPAPKKRVRSRRLMGGFSLGIPLPGLETCEDENCNILGLHDEEDHHSLAGEEHGDEHEGHDHPTVDPDTGLPLYRDPAVVAIFEDRPQLSPRLTHLDDGTEPHLVAPERPSVKASSQRRTSTCPHCGSGDPLAPEHIAHLQPFPDDEFAHIGDRLAAQYLAELGLAAEEAGAHGDEHEEHEDEDHDAHHDDDEDESLAFGRFDEKKDAPAKGDAGKKGKSDGAPKRPKEPAVNPDLEQIALVLEGKMAVRIEVHRAEDILELIDILEEFPMRAALVGASEGRFVAKQIAAAELPVLIDAAPVAPPQEPVPGSGGIARPRNIRGLPPGFVVPNFRRGNAGFTLPVEGLQSADNAALMAKAGVEIAITSGGGESASLLDRAAYAVSQGLDEARALEGITSVPADLLGLDKAGRVRKGHAASLVVFDGNPFLATSRVERVYRDGEVVYKK